jgi:dTDP-4-amino-4,6-dideoxygalactose transaminase
MGAGPEPRMPDLGRPPEIPPEAMTQAMALLVAGRLHRYGEGGGPPGPVARLERDFAALLGRRYAVAVNSCGSALFLALKGAGVRHGDPVLMNAFTLGPVPGALDHIGAAPVLVEITDDLTIDLDDLRAKARASGARHLLLSHMRGHLCDLAALADLCAAEGITLVEDCAHTLGAFWAGQPSGTFGLAGCFSFQSSKHVNAGEGGILVTDDPDLAAQAILHSGSYMLYDQNGTVPDPAVMDRWIGRCGNYSLRMSDLVATLALPQLPLLGARVADWNASHDRISARLAAHPAFALPQRPQAESYAQSSLQFRLPGFAPGAMSRFVQAARTAGVMVKWFGRAAAEGYTSAPPHWPGADAASVPRACALQATLCDIRIPLRLTAAECDRVADVLIATARTTEQRGTDATA